jgi:hypothetical protein
MTATALETADNTATPQPRPGSQLAASVVVEPDPESRAEHAVFRDAAIGAGIGAIVLGPIYTVLVWMATRSNGTPLVGPLLMAAGIGVLAGAFMGGWAGTLVGANVLEKFEREGRSHLCSVPPGG